MGKLSTIKLAIFPFFRWVAVLQGTKKLKLTKILGTTRKDASLAVKDLIGFQSHIESHASISLVNLSNYSVNSLNVDIT